MPSPPGEKSDVGLSGTSLTHGGAAAQDVLAALRDPEVAAANCQAATLLPASCRILAVGEGDFAFSEALVASRSANAGAADGQLLGELVATSFDTEAEVISKYARGATRLEGLRRAGTEVICGVDATRLEEGPLVGARPFDRIIFNFPLLPASAHRGYSCADVHLANREMLSAFLRAAPAFLRTDGLVIIASKDCFPYSWWRIESLPLWSGGGLAFLGMLPWGCTEYPRIYNGPCNVNRDAAVKSTDAVIFVFARQASGEGVAGGFVASDWHRTGGRPRTTGTTSLSQFRCTICRIGALSSEKDLAAHEAGKIHRKRAQLEQRWEEVRTSGLPLKALAAARAGTGGSRRAQTRRRYWAIALAALVLAFVKFLVGRFSHAAVCCERPAQTRT